MNQDVKIKISALDNSQAAFKSVEKSIENTSKKTAGLRDKVEKLAPTIKKATAISTAAFSAIAFSIAKVGIEMDKTKSILIKATGASGDALKDMVERSKDISKHVPQALSDIGDTMGEVNTRLGLTGYELEEATRQFLDFARVTGGEGATSVQKVTRLMGDWGIDVKDTTKLLDQLTIAGQVSGISIDKLATVATNYGVQLRALGFSQTETLALLSKFEKEGVSTEKMVAGLSMALGRMAQEGFDDTAVAFDELTSRIKKAGSTGEATRIAIEMLGSRAGPDFALAVLEGRFAIDDYVDALNNADGALRTTAEASMTLTEQLAVVKNNIMDTLAPTEEMQEKLAEVTNRIVTFVQENGPLIRTIVMVVAAIAGFVAIMGTITLALLAFNPITLIIIGAIAGIIAIVYAINNAIKMFGGTWGGIWEGIKTAAKAQIDFVVGYLKGLIEWVKKTLDALASVPGVKQAISYNKAAFRGVSDLFRADGGPVSGNTPYIVGERGPEMFVPGSNGSIVPNHSLGGGGTVINLTITGNSFMGEEDLAERVGRTLMTTLKRERQLSF